MRGQFSIELVIDVSFILIIVAFLVIFFSSFLNTNSSAVTMSSVCNQIALGINTVSSSNGFSSIQYIPLLNNTKQASYNISVSNGIVVIELVGTDGKPVSALVANTNVVSCGADTRATANETFGLSNLAAYQNENSTLELAYLYGDYSEPLILNNSAYPLTIYGGGFSGKVSLYLVYANGIATLLSDNESGKGFNYSSLSKIEALPTGTYQFYAQENLNSAIHVSLPFSKT